MTAENAPPTWLTRAIAAASFLAVLDLPHAYYQLLRLLVTAYAGYMVYRYYHSPKQLWGWAFAFIALLYNPIFPIEMSKEAHTPINLAIAAAILFEYYRVRDIVARPHDELTDSLTKSFMADRRVPPKLEPTPIAAPKSSSWFSRMGWLVALLAILALALVLVNGVRERGSIFGDAAAENPVNEMTADSFPSLYPADIEQPTQPIPQDEAPVTSLAPEDNISIPATNDPSGLTTTDQYPGEQFPTDPSLAENEVQSAPADTAGGSGT